MLQSKSLDVCSPRHTLAEDALDGAHRTPLTCLFTKTNKPHPQIVPEVAPHAMFIMSDVIDGI